MEPAEKESEIESLGSLKKAFFFKKTRFCNYKNCKKNACVARVARVACVACVGCVACVMRLTCDFEIKGDPTIG